MLGERLHVTPHSTLRAPHLRFTLYTLHSTLQTLHFTTYAPQCILCTPHATLHTLHFTHYTWHSTLFTLHSRLYTVNFKLLTPHCTLYTPHRTLYTPHSTLYTPHFTLYTLHFTLHTPHSTVGERLYVTPHLILHTPYSILHTPHSTLSTPHFTLYTLHLTLQTLHLTLCTLHVTLCPIHSTLYARHFTLCTVHSPHNSQSPPPTVMILSLLVHRLLEAQTICSTFGIVILALLPFATPSSVSLLIPLQTLLFRTPMNAALLSATLHCTVPPQQFTLYTVHPLLQWSSARWFIVYQKPKPSAAPEATRSGRVTKFQKETCIVFWPLPLLVLSASSEDAPVELDGKDTVHGRNDVEHFQRIATAHITFLWICQSETSSIHLFKNNQWFETVQNYCLRSLLFSRWRSLAKIFSWQLLNLHIEILIVR